jgi:hypothetical protein
MLGEVAVAVCASHDDKCANESIMSDTGVLGKAEDEVNHMARFTLHAAFAV